MQGSFITSLVGITGIITTSGTAVWAESTLVHTEGDIALVHSCEQTEDSGARYKTEEDADWVAMPEGFTCEPNYVGQGNLLSAQDLDEISNATNATDYNSSRSNKSY